jgi:hypothetical protein
MAESGNTRTDFIAGQVHGLIAFALAIVATHPNPAALEEQLKTADLVATAKAGAEPVSEDFLDGMADVSWRLADLVGKARQRRDRPRSPP